MVRELFQFGMAGALLWLVVRLKARDAEKLAPVKLKPWIKTVAEIVLSFVAIEALIEPLIPGFAVITVRVPVTVAGSGSVLEHVQARVVPIGLHGPAGGDRIVYAIFDRDGVAEVVSELKFFETHVTIEVFDITQPEDVLKSATVYISPFVKRQLSSKTISF